MTLSILYASRRDRHANIGAGYIGRENFQQMLGSSYLKTNSYRS